MSSTPLSVEILSTRAESETQEVNGQRFDPKLARPFIYKSLSEETRAAYHRAITGFFALLSARH
jgi:hypothetical protein